MATIGTLYPNLVDIAQGLNPDGSIAEVAEILAKANPILDDLPWKPANDGTSHKVTSRLALVTPTWRRYNEGVRPTKSRKQVAIETCGMMADYSKVDVALAKLSGSPDTYRKSEDDAKVASFNLEFARALFYESTATNPQRIYGLAPRFGSTTGQGGSQVVKADASASGNDQTSIWLVGWGPNTVYGIYPRGSMAGLDIRDQGEMPIDDGSGTGAEFQAYVTYFEWQCGLVVHDWRYVVRIANIDTSAWKADLSAGADLVLTLDDAIAALFDKTSVQPVLYMNRQAFAMYNKQLKKAGNNLIEYLERGGGLIPHYQGIPIRVTDAITNTESVVS